MDISKIKLNDEQDLNFKDEIARREISKLTNRKYIFIGDSYASLTNNWVTPLIQKLGLSEDKYYVKAYAGTGFSHTADSKTFITLLQEVLNTLSEEEKQGITHVVVCGGANDHNATYENIKTAISTFVNLVNTNLPNANTYIGAIGWTKVYANKSNYYKVIDAYSKCTNNNKCFYLNNVEYTLHNYDFIGSDGVHPTVEGCQALANNIYSCLVYGTCDVKYQNRGVQIYGFQTGQDPWILEENINNGVMELISPLEQSITVSGITITPNGQTPIDISDEVFKYMQGQNKLTAFANITAYIVANGVTYEMPASIGIVEGKLKLYCYKLSSTGYDKIENINAIGFQPFKITANTLLG